MDQTAMRANLQTVNNSLVALGPLLNAQQQQTLANALTALAAAFALLDPLPVAAQSAQTTGPAIVPSGRVITNGTQQMDGQPHPVSIAANVILALPVKLATAAALTLRVYNDNGGQWNNPVPRIWSVSTTPGDFGPGAIWREGSGQQNCSLQFATAGDVNFGKYGVLNIAAGTTYYLNVMHGTGFDGANPAGTRGSVIYTYTAAR